MYENTDSSAGKNPTGCITEYPGCVMPEFSKRKNLRFLPDEFIQTEEIQQAAMQWTVWIILPLAHVNYSTEKSRLDLVWVTASIVTHLDTGILTLLYSGYEAQYGLGSAIPVE